MVCFFLGSYTIFLLFSSFEKNPRVLPPWKLSYPDEYMNFGKRRFNLTIFFSWEPPISVTNSYTSISPKKNTECPFSKNDIYVLASTLAGELLCYGGIVFCSAYIPLWSDFLCPISCAVRCRVTSGLDGYGPSVSKYHSSLHACWYI